MVDFQLINKMLNNALNKLYNNDASLIIRRTNERSIVFRLGIYLQEELNINGLEEYNLDCEYNRNMEESKSTCNLLNGTYPDLIIHTRESNENNLLILEFKTWWNSNQDNDEYKIREFKNSPYNYIYGATVLIGRNHHTTNVID